MNAGGPATGRILRAEALPGLPGEGPLPIHFHGSHPTPWREGFVVRFFDVSGHSWVGNFQRGIFGLSGVIDWPEAEVLLILAHGDLYSVPKSAPQNYSILGGNVTSYVMVPEHSLICIAYQYGDLVALDASGQIRWERERFGFLRTRLESCDQGWLTGLVEHDYNDSWKPFRIRADNGQDE